MADARAVAWNALCRIDHDGAYANLLVPHMLDDAGLSDRDANFVSELVYGTVRMRRACDYLVDRFCVREPDPEIRSLLRLGAYQLHHLGTPAHAAVSETVELAPKGARGFVNAVLRKVSTAPVRWPDDATRLSYPDWIVDRFRRELGDDDALASLAQMNEAPERTARADGYTQDLASTWVADAVGVLPGMRVVDLCAAPGGKATAMASGGATVIACDLQPHRAALVATNARRLGSRVPVIVADACRPPLRPGSFDRVLLDAPCSGLGSLRRRPDARWRITADDVDRLAGLQEAMLEAASMLVDIDGVLVYSVCTLTSAESLDLGSPGSSFVPVDPPSAPWRPYGDGARLLPHDAGTDGMTLLAWRRTGL
ncbi:MAG: transcription antitermination factor NusB [Acidimicrobiia bacterium]